MYFSDTTKTFLQFSLQECFFFQIYRIHFTANVRQRSNAGDSASRLGHDVHARLEGVRRHHRMDCVHVRHLQEVGRKRTIKNIPKYSKHNQASNSYQIVSKCATPSNLDFT